MAFSLLNTIKNVASNPGLAWDNATNRLTQGIQDSQGASTNTKFFGGLKDFFTPQSAMAADSNMTGPTYQPKSDGGYDYFVNGNPASIEDFYNSGGTVPEDEPVLQNSTQGSTGGSTTQDQSSNGSGSGSTTVDNSAADEAARIAEENRLAEEAARAAEEEKARQIAEYARVRGDETAYNQDQIDMLNRLLGRVGTQSTNAMTNIKKSYDTTKTDYGNEKTRTMNMYDEQGVENSQDKQRGIEDVDQFANRSYSNLMRLLGGAGAGNSSVARTVVPTLVSKAGSTRRAGVFDTYGRNQRDIDSAVTDAENQFSNNERDLNTWKSDRERETENERLNQENDLLGQRKNYEITKGQLSNDDYIKNLIESGQTRSGYLEAKQAGASTQDEINRRMGDLDSLFGKYPTTYTPKSVSVKRPELGEYTVDQGQIDSQGSMPAENSYYLPMLKRRKELTY